mgnify:FL=1
MAEEKVKKREWVKNAAIIFLSIMLVLTFFSNTFLLRSLPEVSTQSVSSGTINTKIRGSGTVAANQTYNVTLEQNRKVDSILVKVGQKVNAGDVLFTLQEGDSKELEEAKDKLDSMEREYRIALLKASAGKYESDNKAVNDAYSAYYEASKKVDELRRNAGIYDNSVNEAKEKVDKAVLEQLTAEKKLAAAKAELSKASGDFESILFDIDNYSSLLSEANRNLDGAIAELDKAIKARDAIEDKESDEYKKAQEKVESLTKAVDSWNNAVNDYQTKLQQAQSRLNDIKNSNQEAYNKYEAAKNDYDTKTEARAYAERQYEEAKGKYGEYNTDYSSYQSAVETRDSLYKAWKNAQDELVRKLEQEKIDDQVQAIGFEATKKEIAKQRKTVEDLSGNNGGNEVTAKVGGTISEINVKAGSEAPAQDALMVIELTDRGYTVSITATAEQAKKVSVGDTAEVSAYWWGSEIKATLESIKNDPSSGGKNKLLVFTLSGDVEPGQNVNLSIGQKSQNYDSIVPKSAVRSDTNGKFVLVLTQKSSPIGNRYVATRVDVKVLAEDDVSAAVTGLSYGDYVITTSSKPIEAGTLVRMAEGA